MDTNLKFKVSQDYIVDFANVSAEDLEYVIQDYRNSIGKKPKTPEDLAEFLVCAYKILPSSAYNIVKELDLKTVRMCNAIVVSNKLLK